MLTSEGRPVHLLLRPTAVLPLVLTCAPNAWPLAGELAGVRR